MNKNAPLNDKVDEKGKEKVEEISEQYERKWVQVQNTESIDQNGSTPKAGVGSSSSNQGFMSQGEANS